MQETVGGDDSWRLRSTPSWPVEVLSAPDGEGLGRRWLSVKSVHFWFRTVPVMETVANALLWSLEGSISLVAAGWTFALGHWH
ncbi:hypothetical protein PF003_g6154 [Phytophthora fragariae]|nr:hypothetical protein PF003_g6154 [Phytophthora fragariae]